MSEPKVTNDDSHDFELWEDFRNGNEKAFSEITKNTLTELVKRNNDLPPTEVVRISTMSGCSTK